MNQKHLIVGAGVFGVILLGFVLNTFRDDSDTKLVTSQVDRGVVQKTVSISGFLEADNLASLAFPQPARISALFVSEGESVITGQLLATSGSEVRAAERQRAIAQLTQSETTRNALLNGLTLEARKVSSTSVEQARVAYQNTIATEDKKVASSLATLYSTDLKARTNDPEEENNAPTISGSFTCTEPGVYNLSVYRSSTQSGYSFRFNGLEKGTLPVSFTQPVKLGECGLSVQFDAGVAYGETEWAIEIPNTNSNGYQQRLRAHELTVEQRTANIEAAAYVYELAQASFEQDVASPRIESIIEANATVAIAQADIARIDAQFADDAIYAPFSGIVTNITSSVGEVTTGPILQLVTNDAFTLVARIPEIDIARISVGQTVVAEFDAASEEILSGTIAHLSPIATLIDGVSYYEANITLDTSPEWLRDGLNADVDIVFEETSDSLRIPSRFLISNGDSFSVLKKNGELVATTTIDVTLEGNDGFVAITGLTEGDTIVAP